MFYWLFSYCIWPATFLSWNGFCCSSFSFYEISFFPVQAFVVLFILLRDSNFSLLLIFQSDSVSGFQRISVLFVTKKIIFNYNNTLFILTVRKCCVKGNPKIILFGTRENHWSTVFTNIFVSLIKIIQEIIWYSNVRLTKLAIYRQFP